MMKHASIVVDLRQLRCELCQAMVNDELATVCPACGAVFDSIMSNYAGFAAKLMRRRKAADIHQCPERLSSLVSHSSHENRGF